MGFYVRSRGMLQNHIGLKRVVVVRQLIYPRFYFYDIEIFRFL